MMQAIANELAEHFNLGCVQPNGIKACHFYWYVKEFGPSYRIFVRIEEGQVCVLDRKFELDNPNFLENFGPTVSMLLDALRIRFEIDENRKHMRLLEEEHKKAMLFHTHRFNELQDQCPHHEVSYHPDASGNNDSSYVCDNCGKESRRLLKNMGGIHSGPDGEFAKHPGKRFTAYHATKRDINRRKWKELEWKYANSCWTARSITGAICIMGEGNTLTLPCDSPSVNYETIDLAKEAAQDWHDDQLMEWEK